MSDPTLRILCVCTGNVCRSPVAERLLRRALGPEVEVTSAGTRALVGAPIAPSMARRLVGEGADADGFSARWLKPPLLQNTDLLLAMTRAHRGDAVEMSPRLVRRSFTLLEFARLGAEVPSGALPAGPVAERLATLVVEAQKHRRPPGHPDDDDVPDPYGLSEADYSASYSAIADAVGRLVRLVRPAPAAD